MSIASVLLSGVNTTSNSEAEKFELSWHELRELDSMSLMADTKGENVRRAERKVMVDDIRRRMMVVEVSIVEPERRGEESGT